MSGAGSTPRGWARARLGEIATTQLGKMLDAAKRTNGTLTPYLRNVNVRWGMFDLNDLKLVPLTDAERDKFTLLPGDVLVCEGGEPGRAAVWDRAASGIAYQKALHRVRPCNGVSPRWVAYGLRALAQSSAFTAKFTGTTINHLPQAALTECDLPVAPEWEQRRVVEALDSYFTRLDDAVATLERVQANLKRYRASVLKAAVEGRLVPTEAELARQEGREYEPTSVAIAQTKRPPRPSRYKSRSHDTILGHAALAVGNPGTPLPEGWAWTPLVDIARLESGHTPSRRHPEWWGGDVPWVGIPDAREHHGARIYEARQTTNADGLANSAARLLPPGTVCLSRTASVGYVVTLGVSMATSQDFVNWICTDALDPDWLRVVFMADRDALLRFGKGTTHTTIYFPEVLSLHVALPPREEQKRVVGRVDELCTGSSAYELAVASSMARCARLRQSILKWAFEGRLVDQDPSDEPASVLLDRIKAEREAAGAATKSKKPARQKKKAKS